MNRVTWIIPARAGSKRIPNKNLQTISGVSLIRRAALTFSNLGDSVIVATDSQAIADEVERLANVKVFHRSESSSTDTASSESVISEVLSQSKIDSDYIGLAQCTTPFTSTEDLKEAHRLMGENHENIVSVFAKPYFVWNENGDAFFNKQKRKRTQEHRIFIENGAFYIFKREKYEGSRFTEGKTVFVVMPENRSMEIDEKNDLKLAQKMANLKKQENKQ